jgi:chlorophyll/bacteriochlorophyll a synthase
MSETLLPRPGVPGPGASAPSAGAVLELLKPITWFAPMWAFLCGVVSSGADLSQRWVFVLGGILLAGPLVCATSQAVNDWFDRHVDAINEPGRPIPSGRIPGRWGLYIAIIWTGLSLALATALGPWVLVACVAGLALSWAYSAPPFRLKRSGVAGPLAVGVSYEGLAWFTGAAVMAGGLPSGASIALAALYSAGAYGIMVLNDFKAVEGDAATGLRSLPVMVGAERAARIACVVMAAPQAVVIALLLAWNAPLSAAIVTALLAAQGLLMTRLLADPRRFAPWYNATGTTLYVLGMLASAFAAAGAGGSP